MRNEVTNARANKQNNQNIIIIKANITWNDFLLCLAVERKATLNKKWETFWTAAAAPTTTEAEAFNEKKNEKKLHKLFQL